MHLYDIKSNLLYPSNNKVIKNLTSLIKLNKIENYYICNLKLLVRMPQQESNEICSKDVDYVF
jgi:transcription initiation factor IIE alpha subunit